MNPYIFINSIFAGLVVVTFVAWVISEISLIKNKHNR